MLPNKPYNGLSGNDLTELVSNIYEDTIRWKKNMFQLPSGKCGKEYIKIVTQWLEFFNKDTTFQGLALKVIMILPNLMLQKPSATSKSKEHSETLQQRIEMWNKGNIQEIWKDGLVIQKKLTSKPQKAPEDVTRIFSRLMFEGKVGAALKFLDENSSNSVLKSTEQVIHKLRTLHPEASEILAESLMQGPLQEVSSAHFNNIKEQSILKAASHTHGSGEKDSDSSDRPDHP